LVTAGNATARVLFARIGFQRHDTTLYFHDESNVGIHPEASDSRTKNVRADGLIQFFLSVELQLVIDVIDSHDRENNTNDESNDKPEDLNADQGNVVLDASNQSTNGRHNRNTIESSYNGVSIIYNADDLVIVDINVAARYGGAQVENKSNNTKNEEENVTDNHSTTIITAAAAALGSFLFLVNVR
jgi:hypothetical protein